MSRLKLACGLALVFAATGRPDDQQAAGKSVLDLSSLSLEQLMDIKVEAAALHPQTLTDAPASVTILTSDDIYKYGYRTLGEALASVRGFYISNNRSYETVGVRGFNLPGDYASRILVTVNGHNMADNILNFMLFFGPDFPIDMSLIKQIEIIRGPSSALYGSNGIFATVNIITKAPGEAGPASLMTGAGSFGEKQAQVTAAAPLGESAKLLLAGSVFNNTGESPLYFSEYDAPETNHGNAVNMDGHRGYHVFSNLVWRNWNFTAVLASRVKIQPISWGDTIFNDRGTHIDDARNYIEATYSRAFQSGTLRWRTFYDVFHERARFDYPLADSAWPRSAVEDNRQDFLGDWIGTQLTYRFDLKRLGTLTVGSEAKFDLRNLQAERDVSPQHVEIMNIDKRDKAFALFIQDERRLSDRWKLALGLRFDYSAYRHNFLSPRVALIYQPSRVWSYKLLYGRGFRNPSAFELYFDDARSGAPNPNARPEKGDTIEADVERRIGKRTNLIVSVYGYQLRDLLVGVYTEKGFVQYQNIGRATAAGVEFEINGHPSGWLEAAASYSIERAADNDADGIPENSPKHLAKLRLAAPLGRKFELASGIEYYSSRRTLAGAWVDPVYLADFTVTSKHLSHNFDLQFGIRNAFNHTYFDPIALNPRVDAMRQPGRSFFVELITRAAE